MADRESDLPAATAALSLEDRQGLVNALQASGLAGPDILGSLSPNIKKRVEFLRNIQSQHDELEAKFSEEKAALEAKYQKLYEPFYTTRSEIVTGAAEVDGIVHEAVVDKEEKGVPDFWLNAMKNNEILADEINERDDEALKYLKDIKWCKIDDPKGFKLDFYFDPNPYFKNSILTKIYHMLDEEDPILENAIGTDIEWFPGKCLTEKTLRKRPKKGCKNTKPITRTEPCESFFNFFNPPEVPDDDDEEELEEDTVEELQERMEQDYDIGSTIRDKIIPHAVSWFTGEAAEDDEFELADDEDDGEEEEETEDEDDDDEEEEHKSDKKVRK